MATHDYVIANGTGAAVRSDLNGALAAIVSQNSSASAPATTYAYMLWADTTAGIMKMRNGANSAWISLWELDGTFIATDISLGAGTAGAPSLYFTGDTNTGIYSPGADQVGISTGGTARITVDGSGNVNIDSNTVYVDAANNRVGIGTQSPGSVLQVNSGTNLGGILIGFNAGSSNFYDADLQVFRTGNGTERARIDSSGRLLVGTSSDTESTTLLLQGNSGGGSTDAGLLRLCRGTSSPANGAALGYLAFGDSGHAASAYIAGERDGGTWNTSTSRPTRLVFSTTADGAASPTERMRINNGGNVRMFAGAGQGGLALALTDNSASGQDGITLAHSATGIAGSGTVSFKVIANGNVTNTNNSYGAISDAKLKENIVDANSQWSDLKALQVRNYNLKEGQTHTQIGLVAQEAELVSPGLVSESPDRDAEGNDLGTVTKSVNYSVLYMKAVKALQEAMERIEALEADVAQLKGA